MTESDFAKLVFADIIKAIEGCRRYAVDRGWDYEISFPHSVEVNGQQYVFTDIEDLEE